MNGDKYSLFVEILEMLISWSKDYKVLPQNSTFIINKFNSYLLHNNILKPTKNLRETVSILKDNTVGHLGFNVSDDLNNHNIISDEGLVDNDLVEWLEDIRKKDDQDQDLVKTFLYACRNEYKLSQDNRITEMYSKVRSFINSNNYILTPDKITELISTYSNVSKSILGIRDWYESYIKTDDVIFVCPICGKLLDNGLLKEDTCSNMCMYYINKGSLDVKGIQLKKGLKYKKLKNGIYNYTLLPGIAELRIYNKLVSLHGGDKVSLYPNIDKFDIEVKDNNTHVYLDVKDFKSPYDLVEMLVNNNSFEKMNTTSESESVFLVIPEHRKYIYNAGDYKKIVKSKIKANESQVQVIYENEVYRKVSDILDEF